MNYWTLQFQDYSVQQSYSICQEGLTEKRLDSQCWLILLLLILFLLELGLKSQWVGVSIYGACLILLLFYQIVKHRIKLIQKIFFVSIVFMLTIYKPNMNALNGLQTSPATFSDTLVSIIASFCLVNNLDYIKQTLTILIIFLTNFIIQYQQSHFSILTMLQDLIYLGIILLYIYQKEKWQKINFIETLNQIKINEILYNQLNLQQYRVAFNSRLRSFHLLSKNLQEMINSTDQDDFFQMIRQIQIVMKKTGKQLSEQVTPKRINEIVTLEQFLYEVMNEKQSIKQQHMVDQKEHWLIGRLNEETYQIFIHSSFYLQPCVLIFVKKNYKENYIEELKLKRDIIMRGLDTVQDIFFTNIKPCLIYYVWIKQYSNMKTNGKLISLLHKVIEAKLFKAQHEYQNLKDFFNINQSFQRTVIVTFNLDKVLEFIMETARNTVANKRVIKINLENKLFTKIIKSDQVQFIQLFFNLLFFIIDRSDQITISIKDHKIEQGSDDVMQIKLDYLGTPISKQYLLNLPIINPQSLLDYRHNANGTFSLELPMALMIVRKLGPQDKIIYRQVNRGEVSLELYLYKTIPFDMHLLPVISLKPSKNILFKSSQLRRRLTQLIYDDFYDNRQRETIQTNREL